MDKLWAVTPNKLTEFHSKFQITLSIPSFGLGLEKILACPRVLLLHVTTLLLLGAGADKYCRLLQTHLTKERIEADLFF